jgi:hypothetical protein
MSCLCACHRAASVRARARRRLPMGDAASRRASGSLGSRLPPSRDAPVLSPFLWGSWMLLQVGWGNTPCRAVGCRAVVRRAERVTRRQPGGQACPFRRVSCCCEPGLRAVDVLMQVEVGAGAGRPHPCAPWPWPRRPVSCACSRASPPTILCCAGLEPCPCFCRNVRAYDPTGRTPARPGLRPHRGDAPRVGRRRRVARRGERAADRPLSRVRVLQV